MLITVISGKKIVHTTPSSYKKNKTEKNKNICSR